MNTPSPKQFVLQEMDNDEQVNQDTIVDVKFQHIIYYLQNPGRFVDSKKNIPVDFIKAMNEMKNLDYNYEDNFIGFENKKTNECVQFIRKGEDDWYAEVPITHGKGWDGYAWCCDTKSKPVMDMVRLFFEEVPWFGMLDWKMRRFKH